MFYLKQIAETVDSLPAWLLPALWYRKNYRWATCSHIDVGIVENCQKELDEQYASGKWLKRDMARDALEWAKQRSASVKIDDLPNRIGGKVD